MRGARLVAIGLAIVLAVGALTFTAAESRVRSGDALDQIMSSARRLRELDAQLDRGVLESQRGLTLDYDDLTATLREMGSIQTVIEQSAGSAPALVERIRRSRTDVTEKARLVEQFESANSILRNSLFYIPLAARRVGAGRGRTGDDGGRDEVAALLATVLRCNADCSATTVGELRRDIALLAAWRDVAPAPSRDAVSVLLRHSFVVADAAPRAQAAVRSLLDADSQPYDQLYAGAHDLREGAIARADRSRMLLIALAVMLLAGITATVIRLRRSAVDLKGALLDLAAKKLVVEQNQAELESLNATLELRVERRTSELSASREQYRALVETTQAIPWEMAPGTLRFAYVGPQATALLGHSTEEWLAAGFLERILHAEDRAEAVARLDDASAEAADAELELRLVGASGTSVWLRALVHTTPDLEGRPIRRGLFLDVTARHMLEAELRAAQKLESVGRLASGVAHEINTPIQFASDNVHFVKNAFDGLLAVMRSWIGVFAATPDERDTMISRAHAETEAADIDYLVENIPAALDSAVDGLGRVAAIVSALKQFSHPDRTEKSPTGLSSCVRNTLAIAANEYKHVADVITELGDVPEVVCHAGEINQVLLNLIVNAAQAIADDVTRMDRRGVIAIRTWTDGESAFVSVHDDGPGIPPSVRDKIFDPFFTTKDVGRGTGQGLAISRSIVVDKHAGDLRFETELGHGTTFVVRLPLVPPQQLHAAA